MFRDRRHTFILPTMVLVERTYLYTKSRIAVDTARVRQHLVAASNCVLYPLDEPVALRIPTELSIHDAIIVATALVYRDIERGNQAYALRLLGEIAVRCDPPESRLAETCYRQALALTQRGIWISRHQQARVLELHAAMSLARLWQRQDKRAAAYELLEPIYGWFTEGFDTADLQEAKTLLEDLS